MDSWLFHCFIAKRERVEAKGSRRLELDMVFLEWARIEIIGSRRFFLKDTRENGRASSRHPVLGIRARF
jgi:hypothetical protein